MKEFEFKNGKKSKLEEMCGDVNEFNYILKKVVK